MVLWLVFELFRNILDNNADKLIKQLSAELN